MKKILTAGSGIYSKKIMEHFLKPKNLGKIKDADAIGKAGNPTCGDEMYLYLKIKKKKIKGKIQEYIHDIKFETLGCAAAIAVSSLLTEMVKGKSIEEARKIKNEDIAKSLNLPSQKFHCSLLGQEALANAIDNYYKRKKLLGAER